MGYRGVFLDKVHPNIRKKLDLLHANAGDVQRTYKLEEQQIPWIKLTSNAASREPGFPVAADYVLYADLIDSSPGAKSHKKLEGWKEGGGLYGSNHLNRPVPVIESITVSNKGALGSIRTASIKGSIFAETDLVWMEKLYMMPGITLLLEWGHSNTNIAPIVYTTDTTAPNIQTSILSKALQTDEFTEVKEAGMEPQLVGAVKDVGTYDAMLGVITKFNWNNNPQGYGFTIDIISPNSVMNTFDMSTNKLGIKVKSLTTVNDSSREGVDKDTKKETTINVQPMEDLEGLLTHLSVMGTSVSQSEKSVGLKKNDEGQIEDMGPAPSPDEDNSAEEDAEETREYEADVEIDRKTSKKTELIFDAELLDSIPYSLSGKKNEEYTIIKNKLGHLVGMTARVPNNETFGTGKDDVFDMDKTKLSTFITYSFLEELINSMMPGDSEGHKKLVKIQSTTLNTKDGKYHTNNIFSSETLASVNRGVCFLVGDNTLPFNFETGMFSDFFPTWTNKERFSVLRGNQFVTNEEEFNKFAKHFHNGDGTGGSLDGVMINVDFILQKYKSNKSEFNKFLYAVLDGVNSACGSPWDFHIQNNPNDPQKMAVVDLNHIDEDVAEGIRADRDNNFVYKFKTNLGILRNITMRSKLPKAIASSAFVAASAANAGDYKGGTGMNLYGTIKEPGSDQLYSIYDYISKRNAKDIDANEFLEEGEKNVNKLTQVSPENDMMMSAWKSIVFGKDVGTAQNKMKEYVDKEIFQKNESNPSLAPPIPLELSFSIDGLSGIYMGNAIMMDTISEGGVLPDRYFGTTAFQVTQVSHTVNAGGWDTDITCMMRKLTKVEVEREKANPPKRKPQTIVEEQAPTPTPGGNGPPSSRAINALHPEVLADWEDIVDDLRDLGWQPKVITAFRSIEEQGEKLAKGLSKVGYGYHGCLAADGSRASQALDVIDGRYSYGNSPKSIREIGKKATEDKARAFWGDLGRIAEDDYGFRWGGKFGKNGSAYYDFEGTPSSNKIMGWDPGHIEKFGKDGLPTLTEAAENAGKFLGRKIHLRANNVV